MMIQLSFISIHTTFRLFFNSVRWHNPRQLSSFRQDCLLANANDTASWSATGIASLLGVWVTSLSKIVGASVNDDGTLCDQVSSYRRGWTGWACRTYANDTLGSNQLDELVLNRSSGVSLSIGLDVSQVTYMAFRI
jgi:hypothetical protein